MKNWWPLLLTLVIQAMVAMALLSLPVVAPVVAQTLQVSPALVGLYVSVTYAGAMVATLMGGATVPSEHSEEAALDLRDVLKRLRIDRLTAHMTAIAAQVADPEVRQRYRTLETQKKALIEELESVKLV
jgi:hypothetical protein